MNTRKFIRDLQTVKKEKTPRFRETYRMRDGTTVLCESKQHYEYIDTFCRSLEDGSMKPEDVSIKQLFEGSIPDGRELVETFDPRKGGSSNRTLVEAAGAIASSDFSSISGQIVYTRLIEKLQAEENVFTQMIPTQSTPYDGERIAGIDGLGDSAEIVPEGENYPLISVGEDWIDTPSTTKRGFIVPITKEAIFFDRTGRLLQEAGKVGESLAINKEKRAIDCVIDENTTAHRYKWRGTTYATYQTTSPWDNITASNGLLDWTDIDAANQTLNGITDPSTGEPVVVEADTLICCKQLEMIAQRIINATTIRVATPGWATSSNPNETELSNPMSGAYNLVSTRLLAARQATDTTWYYGNPKKAFVYMENWPIAVITEEGGYEMFHRDIVTQYRCSERGQYATLEPRMMTENTA